MSLEFTKIISDIEQMGRYLAYRDSEELIERALRILNEQGSSLDFIRERIRMVRESDVSGYRGAAPPSDTAAHYPFHQSYTAPAMPPEVIVIAADGSQIYPDFNASSLYYLLNIGVLVYTHGTGSLPHQETLPGIFYTDAYMLDEQKQVVSNRTVNSRRTIAEIRVLWQQARQYQHEGVPHIALHDGNLLKFFGGSDITDSNSLVREYMGLLVGMQDTGAIFAGYIDNPRSSYLISLLHLLELEPEQIHDANLRTNGDLEGLTDAQVFARLLGPGERSAIMVQNSPTNYEFTKVNPSHEIAAFYVNVSDNQTPHIARVDVPLWVARHPDAVNTLHSTLLAQCRMQGLRPYPYVLTRADELAYISGREKEQVEQLVKRELTKRNMKHKENNSAKASSKDFAREGFRTEFRVGGNGNGRSS